MKKSSEHDEFLEALGRTIKKYRKENQLTQEQLATKIGSESENDKRSYISKLENGKRNPSATQLKRLSEVLHVSVYNLLNEAAEDEREHQWCELYAQCHNKESFTIVQKFLNLSPERQADVIRYMEVMQVMDNQE